MQRLMPIPDKKELPLNFRLLSRLQISATPAVPMRSKPMLKRANEQSCALQCDSRTNIHRDPISSAAVTAAMNAWIYALLILVAPARELYHPYIIPATPFSVLPGIFFEYTIQQNHVIYKIYSYIEPARKDRLERKREPVQIAIL